MKTQKRISSTLPSEVKWEEESKLIYIRENIVFIDGEFPIYSYDETVCSVSEFLNTRFTQLRADLDYLSMMAEVDL